MLTPCRQLRIVCERCGEYDHIQARSETVPNRCNWCRSRDVLISHQGLGMTTRALPFITPAREFGSMFCDPVIGAVPEKSAMVVREGWRGRKKKVAPEKREELKRRGIAGENMTALAIEYGVSTSAVSRIVSGER
jgi:hypothetical protein